MEETVSTSGNSLVTVYTSRANDTDGGCQFAVLGVHLLHHACLDARRVRAQQDIFGDVIGML